MQEVTDLWHLLSAGGGAQVFVWLALMNCRLCRTPSYSTYSVAHISFHTALTHLSLPISHHQPPASSPERDAWTSQHYPVSACSCLHCSSSLPHLFQPLLLSKPYLCDPSFMLHYFQNKIQSFNRPCRERCDLFCVNHFVKAAWR